MSESRSLPLAVLFLLLMSPGINPLDQSKSSFELPQASSTYKQGAATVIQLGEKGTQDLFDRWISQAISGLFAAVAQRHIGDVDAIEREVHKNCSKVAQDVPEHAKCVARLLRAAEKEIRESPSPSFTSKKPRPSTLKKKKRGSLRRKWIPYRSNTNIKKTINKSEPEDEYKWEGSFRMARVKREARKIKQQSSYSLSHPYDEPAFAQIARYMTSGVRALSGSKPRSWQKTLSDIHQTADEAKMEKRRKKALMRRLKSWINNTPKKLDDGWRTDALEMMDDQLKRKEEMLKKAKATEDIRVPLKVLREAIKLGMTLSGQNMTGFDKKTIRLGSPRFFSLVKDETDKDTVSLLSPSLFSLHEDGSNTEQHLSLPHILKKLSKKEQNAWMDFIVEASGVGDAVDEARLAKKKEKDMAMRTPDGTPLYFNKKNLTDMYGKKETDKVDLFEKMAHKYNDRQKSALDKDGFAFMTEEQIEMMYGKDSPYHDPDRILQYKEFAMLDEDSKHHQIKKEILEIGDKAYKVTSQNVSQLARKHRGNRAKRDIVLSPIVNTPLVFASTALSNTFIVLSPVVFSPVILSPATMGPFILSPWLFIPVILSPRVLSPLIVNPLIFSPVILSDSPNDEDEKFSPLALHPFILAPGIFNPFILSPFVLSPFILSPQVFTPVILSPFALSPVILTPMVGSPVILSPFVLSPIILSPQALFAVVLSPYALSPLVESKLIASEVVLSPSFLS